MPSADPVFYENVFWSMLVVVTIAMGGGALTGFIVRIRTAIVACAMLAVAVAVAALLVSSQEPVESSRALLSVAALMFTFVIAVAFSLLVRRVRMRGASR